MRQKAQHVSIATIRDEFKKKEQKEIEISYKSKRGKVTRITGIVSAAYPNIFTIQVFENESMRNMSFNYSDIVSGDVMVIN
ncbi:MAG: hypothetical protein FWG30_11075 [Eubacteriaceae bacterium]|nr:hypothetical protein [Eubacteriaceae bacterium]